MKRRTNDADVFCRAVLVTGFFAAPFFFSLFSVFAPTAANSCVKEVSYDIILDTEECVRRQNVCRSNAFAAVGRGKADNSEIKGERAYAHKYMKTKIGGQAVIEGVMMRGASAMALAVRDENGEIRIQSERLPEKKPWYRKVPFLRGIVNLVISMIDGMRIIGKSAEVMVEDEIDTSDGKGMKGMMFVSVLLGLALAVALFILLPTYLTGWILEWCGLTELKWLKSLIEGVLKMFILIGYMGGISCMKEIRRVYMYHGAEHKTIACYENELPLTVENVKKCSRYHDRCGTSFIVFVVILSVILMFAVEAVCYAVGFEQINVTWIRSLIKLAMLPLTAGISYEMLMLLARSNFVLFRPLKWLGKQFQKLTTREPDDGMCEVAIAAFNTVLEMDADPTVPEQKFPGAVPLKVFREQIRPLEDYSVMEKCDEDWILCAVLNVKRNELRDDLPVPYGWQLRVEKMIKRCASGEPLQYVLGNTDFYGRIFALDENVLIPRQETELVAEQLIKRLTAGQTVLDMCCGSGVIGITAALEKNVSVTLADIDKKALKIAGYNAKKLKARVKTVQSDMFASVKGKFDAVVCNPPYIESDVVDSLEEKVRKYEPRKALDGGKDGLDFYRVIARDADRHLKKGGLLILEIGYNQKEAAEKLLAEKYHTETLKDYGGNDRIVVAALKQGK